MTTKASQDIYPLEPIDLSAENTKAWEQVDKAVKHWMNSYLEPGPNGLSEADKAFLARIYTPHEQIVTKLIESLDSREAK